MPSLITSDNGVSSGSAGLKTTAASDGILALQTTTVGGTATTAVYVDTSQNVGVGTTSPAQKLQVLAVNGTGFAGAAIQNQNTNVGIAGVQFSSDTTYFKSAIGHVRNDSNGVGSLVFYNASSTGAANWSTSDARMTLTSAGYLGIGTSSPDRELTVVGYAASKGTNSGYLLYDGGTTFYGGLEKIGTTVQLSNATANPLTFSTGGSERTRIDSSGYFMVGKSTTSISTQGAVIGGASDLGFCSFSSSATSNSSITLQVYSTGAAANRFYVGYAGTVFATNTTISAISDIRFKENVRDLDAGLAEIMALQPRLYDWKEGKGADIKNARGFIAQEFEQVFPDLIDEWADPAPEGEEPYKSVRADLIPVLVKAIQELNAKVDAQAAEIAALKGTQP